MYEIERFSAADNWKKSPARPGRNVHATLQQRLPEASERQPTREYLRRLFSLLIVLPGNAFLISGSGRSQQILCRGDDSDFHIFGEGDTLVFSLAVGLAMPVSPAQIRAARAMLGWSIMNLSVKARVSVSTVKRFEDGKDMPVSVDMMQDALETEGIRFIEDAGGSGVLLRKMQRPASRRSA